MPGSSKDNSRILTIYAYLVGFLILLGAGIWLTWSGGDFDQNEFARSLGSNILASLIWAVVVAGTTSWVVNRIQEQAIKTVIDQQMESHRVELMTKLSQETQSMSEALSGWVPRYLPAVEYPPSDGFDDAYNRDLMHEMESTKSYCFQGPSSRFVAPRLDALVKGPEAVRIAMTDPQLKDAIRLRAKDRVAAGSPYSATKLQQMADQLHEELLGSVVALFDLRYRCTIHVVFVDHPAVYRYEMTDRSLFLSWYHSKESALRAMPEAMKFEDKSMLYGILDLEMNRRFDSITKGYRFAAGDPDDRIVEVLRGLGLDNADATTVEGYRNKHMDQTKSFRAYLDSARVRGVF